jgi:hypothetical protein
MAGPEGYARFENTYLNQNYKTETAYYDAEGNLFFYSKAGYARMEKTAMINPRYANGSLRRKHRARFKAMQLPCAICGKPIHYDEPSDAMHPWSFVIDEIKPVSRWKEWGYESAKACADDWNNLQACHWRCNQIKSNKVPEDRSRGMKFMLNLPDGEW